MLSKVVHLLVALSLMLVAVGPRRAIAATGRDSPNAASPAGPVLPGGPTVDGPRGNDSVSNPLAFKGAVSPLCASRALAGDAPQVLRREGGTVADQYIALLLSSDELKEFRASLQKSYSHYFSFQPQESYVVSYGNLVGTYIPISGGAGHSFYSVWFDRASRQVVETAAALFRIDSNSNIEATIESGSGLVMDAVLTSEGEVLGGAIQANGQTLPLNRVHAASPTGFWDCFGDCFGKDPLTPPWLPPVLGALCAVICKVPLPLALSACLVCLITIAGLLIVPCAATCLGRPVPLAYLPMIRRASDQ